MSCLACKILRLIEHTHIKSQCVSLAVSTINYKQLKSFRSEEFSCFRLCCFHIQKPPSGYFSCGFENIRVAFC